MTQSVKKKGYIDVKIPAKSRNGPIKKWKAWKRRWVVAHGLHDITSGAPIITIDIYPYEQMENQQFERTTVYLNNIKSISRTISKTHPYAFQVITEECTLLLSGKSETDSQGWISVFRRVLWPAASKVNLEDSIGGVFDAVVIECLSPIAATLKGVIGHVIILPSVILIGSLETGGILYDWPLKMIISVRLMSVSNVADKGKIVAIETSSEATLCGKFHLFSEKGEALVDALSSCLKECKMDISSETSDRQRRISTLHLRTMSSGRSSGTSHHERYVQLRKSSEDWSSSSTEFPAPSDSTRSHSLVNLNPEVPSFNPKMENLAEEDHKSKSSDLISSDNSPSHRTSKDSVILRNSRINKICSSRLSSSMSNLSDILHKQANAELAPSIKSTGCLHVAEDTCKSEEPEAVKLRRPSQGLTKPVCSRTSRDSGVGACNADDSIAPSPPPSSGDVFESNQRPPSLGDYENLFQEVEEVPWRYSSSSSEGTIYSEIDFDHMQATAADTFTKYDPKYDPIYEDLELFRKDIHKLLGMPLKAGETLSKPKKEDSTKGNEDKPPPLPPRKYIKPLQPVDIKHKDVYKFLGVDDKDDCRVATRIPASPATITRRRKNICSFLGIPTMPESFSSQPIPDKTISVDNQETYDTVIGLPRRYNPAIPQPEDKSLTYSGSLRSYVRPKTLQRLPEAPSPLPTKKRLKKRSGSFLRLLSSSRSKDLDCDARSATYVRYDWSVPEHLEDFRASVTDVSLPNKQSEVLKNSPEAVITSVQPVTGTKDPPKIVILERTPENGIPSTERFRKNLNRLSDDVLQMRLCRSSNRYLEFPSKREPRSKSADTKSGKSTDDSPTYENFEIVREALLQEAAMLKVPKFPSGNTANEDYLKPTASARPRTNSIYTDMTGPHIRVDKCEDTLEEFMADGNYSRFNLDIDSDYMFIDFQLKRAEQQLIDQITLMGLDDEVFPLNDTESEASQQVAQFAADSYCSTVTLESVFTYLGELRSLCDSMSMENSLKVSASYESDSKITEVASESTSSSVEDKLNLI